MDTATKKIDGFSLESILQIFNMEARSQTLKVTKEDDVGYLDLQGGELINAELNTGGGVQGGLEAAMEILVWDDVKTEVLPLRQVQRTITKSFNGILMEAAQLKDDRKAMREESGEDLLQSAIEKAEMQQYKQAHDELVAFLKKRKDSVIGWIWFARIQGNVEVIRKSLNMAASINPEDPLLKEEQRKFAKALPTLHSGVARKCYFCWTPLDRNAATCIHCKGHLNITTDTLAHTGEMDPRQAEQAQDRYLRILKKYPRSLTAVYCLALIQINRGKLQQALVYLERATKMAPDRALFAGQLKLLLDYLAKHSQGKGEDSAGGAEEVVIPAVDLDDGQQTVPGAAAKPLILVVEDSATTRKVIAITLTRNGYRVMEAGDGMEALSKISEERPNLIMLDVILPKMDGYKILAIIKKNEEFKDIPVIMLTSKDGFLNKMKGRMSGAAAYLTKPFDPTKMIEEIKKHVY